MKAFPCFREKKLFPRLFASTTLSNILSQTIQRFWSVSPSGAQKIPYPSIFFIRRHFSKPRISIRTKTVSSEKFYQEMIRSLQLLIFHWSEEKILVFRMTEVGRFHLSAPPAPLSFTNMKKYFYLFPEGSILPCQSTCYRVKRKCNPLMKKYGIEWPEELNCPKFPEHNTGVCIQPSSFLSSEKGRLFFVWRLFSKHIIRTNFHADTFSCAQNKIILKTFS